jgi:hypothetical protein
LKHNSVPAITRQSTTTPRERVMQPGKVSRDRVTSTSVREKFLINENFVRPEFRLGIMQAITSKQDGHARRLLNQSEFSPKSKYSPKQTPKPLWKN